MLDNLVNRHDAARLRRKLTSGDLGAVVAKLRGTCVSTERVVREGNTTDREPTQWFSIPAVRRRWNLLVSGDEQVDAPAYLAATYLEGRAGLRALSLGCGTGARELRWAELGVFERLDGFDISPGAIEVARAAAVERGLDETVHFRVQDFTELVGAVRYDVVIAEHSLHHLAPMPEVVSTIAGLLEPDGLFFVDEYVGPDRFQWPDRQLAEAQAVLETFPARLLRALDATRSKDEVIRPSRLWMYLTDPSEAIDSARIRPVLHDVFEVASRNATPPYGGGALLAPRPRRHLPALHRGRPRGDGAARCGVRTRGPPDGGAGDRQRLRGAGLRAPRSDRSARRDREPSFGQLGLRREPDDRF